MSKWKDKLGKPNIQIQGLNIWIHNREAPDSNWLLTTVYCHNDITEVWIEADSFIGNDDFQFLKDNLETFLRTHQGKAFFGTSEQNPVLEIEINQRPDGNKLMTIFLKSVFVAQKDFRDYKFDFEVSDNDLQLFLSQLTDILRQYPHLSE
jgi:hypothetical protein